MNKVKNPQMSKPKDFTSECNVPLFEGCTQSKLSMCVRLLAHKANYSVADKGVDDITEMLLDVTPFKDNLPATSYDAERLVMKLGLKVDKIDCCINGCMLFYDNEIWEKWWSIGGMQILWESTVSSNQEWKDSE